MPVFSALSILNHSSPSHPPEMNTLIVLSFCLLAIATAMPDMTPQQRAQYDSIKTQAVSRLSQSGQQAQMRMDSMEQQMDSYYQSLPQSTRNELDSFHDQMMSTMRSIIYGNNNMGF